VTIPLPIFGPLMVAAFGAGLALGNMSGYKSGFDEGRKRFKCRGGVTAD
jgi:hypothetical protein